MTTANPDLIKSSPSPLRTGLVGLRFTVVLYPPVVCFRLLVNFTINGIAYLSIPDVTGQVDQAAMNFAFVTGVFLFVCEIVSATVNMRASALSGGLRPVLTVVGYVHSIVITGLGPFVWWLLTAIHPPLFAMGRKSFPLGVDSWAFVLLAWVACDGVRRSIGGPAHCIGSTWERVSVLMGTILSDIYAIDASAAWLVFTLVHKSSYPPPMHPAFYLLGLISLAAIASDWPLTALGYIGHVG